MSVSLYGVPNQQYQVLNGITYSADATGLIANVADSDKKDLTSQGCIDPSIWAGVLASIPSIPKTIAQTVYSLEASDNTRTLVFTSGSSITLIIPFGLPLGFACNIVQFGAGTVAITAAAAVNYYSSDGYVQTATQYSLMSLTGSAQDVYILTGDGSV